MARLSKKAKIEPVREANELAVENEYVEEVKEEAKAEKGMKADILADVKRVALSHQEYGLAAKLWIEEIEAILNKYM